MTRSTTARLAAAALLFLSFGSTYASELTDKAWIHGSADCATNRDPAIDVFQFDRDTFILRQNKCVHYEAPFIYMLFGKQQVFIQDTGATEDPAKFPLYETVGKLIHERGESVKILVTHSHSHGDHIAGDSQFRGKPGVTLIEPTAAGVEKYLGLARDAIGTSTIDLGSRQLTVLRIPGHQDESVAIYDPQTRWLLTGDTVYPGRLYVRDWTAFRSSIHRLAEFTKTHEISAVMGTHIEMSRTPGKDYPVGSTFQPEEPPLPLTVEDLLELDRQLQQAGETPKRLVMPKIIVFPK